MTLNVGSGVVVTMCEEGGTEAGHLIAQEVE